jgi:hypothetical protein
MSDTTTMPFQPGTMDDAPEAPQLDDSPGNKRILLILGAVAGLAVLAIAAYFLLFAGGSDDKAADPVVPPRSGAQPSTAPSTAPKAAVQPKISARNFGTDPFKALISDGAASTTTTTGTTTTGTTTPPVTTPPVVTPPTTTPPSTPPSGAAYRFKVINVASGNEHARVSLNGDEETIAPGDVVGGKFKAIRFQGGKCGTFKFGDEPAFDLCEGSPAVKR